VAGRAQQQRESIAACCDTLTATAEVCKKERHMKKMTLFSVCATFLFLVGTSIARAGDVCAIHSAIRDGEAVKVVFSKGFPSASITRSNGSKIFINNAVYKPNGLSIQNKRDSVVLHKGDKLGIIGMDSGCTITVVGTKNALKLRIDGGRFIHFMAATSSE